jgi:hypothetical protein
MLIGELWRKRWEKVKKPPFDHQTKDEMASQGGTLHKSRITRTVEFTVKYVFQNHSPTDLTSVAVEDR